MKKMLIVVFVLLILTAHKQDKQEFSLLNYFSGQYTAYTSSSDENSALNLGFCYMLSNPNVADIIGESIVINDFEVTTAINQLNARVVKTEYLDDGTIIMYCYTPLINDSVDVSNQKVNLQIATKNDRTVVGWPLILGSY